jgi:hypothetical protein
MNGSCAVVLEDAARQPAGPARSLSTEILVKLHLKCLHRHSLSEEILCLSEISPVPVLVGHAHAQHVDLYIRTGPRLRYADLYIRTGPRLRYADLYIRTGPCLRCADLYIRTGPRLRCADLYIRTGPRLRCADLYIRTGADLDIRTVQRLYECLMRAGLICDMITLGVNRQLAEIELRGSPARPLHPARSLGPAVAVWPLRIIMEVS